MDSLSGVGVVDKTAAILNALGDGPLDLAAAIAEPAAQEPHTPDPQPVGIKEHWQLLPFCQQVQPSSAVWCSPPPSQMAGRTPHAVPY